VARTSRFTADIDFLIRPTRANAELVVQTLREFGFGGLRVVSDDLCQPGRVLQLAVKPNRIDLITSVAGLSFEEAWDSRVGGATDLTPFRCCSSGAMPLFATKKRPHGLKT
jgi:hypothetical protein